MSTLSLVRILAVDDDPVSLSYISHVCQSIGMECTTAASASEALNCMEHDSYSTVIADWNMPDFSGLDLCKSIRAVPRQMQPYFILISDHNGDSFIKDCLAAKVDQFISKPVPVSVLKYTLNNAQKWITLQQLEQNLTTDIQRIRGQLESDLLYFRQAQAQILPRNGQRVGAAQLSLYSRPREILSSDLLSVFQADEEHLAFFHVEVPGAGLSSALRTFGFSRLVSPVFGESLIFRPDSSVSSKTLRSPAEVMHALNDRYVNSPETVGPVSALYGVFNQTSRMLSMSIAGMAPPVLWIRGEAARVFGAAQGPLGVGPQRYSEFKKKLLAGDRVILYSPALIHLKSSSGEPLGLEGLCSLVNSNPEVNSGGGAVHVVNLVQRWLNCSFDELDIQDDLTVLGLDFLEEADLATQRDAEDIAESISEGLPRALSLSNDSDPTTDVRAHTGIVSRREFGFVAGLSNERRRAVLLVDDKSMKSTLMSSVNAEGFELQCLPTDYFMRAEDPVFNALDFVFIESSDRSFRAAKWVQLITDLKLLKRPHIVCCYQQAQLKNSVELGQLGADGFLRFPVDVAHVQFVLQTGLRQLALRHSVEQQSRSLQRLTSHVESDLRTLAQMQSRVLPGKLDGFDSLAFKWIYRPAEKVSGDFLQVFPINESQIGFYVLDAVGQGVKAAIRGWSVARMMTEMYQSRTGDVRELSNALTVEGLDCPASVLRRLNASLLAMPSEFQLSCAMVCGILNCFTGHGVLAYAGFPPAFITGAQGRVTALAGQGPKLGMQVEASYENVRFLLQAQERLSLCSDGLPQMLGVFESTELMTEDFKLLVSTMSQGSLKEYVAALNERLNGSPGQQSRDVTLLTLELEASNVVTSKELNILELLDRYFPIMGQSGLNGRLPDTGRVFQAHLTPGGIGSLGELLRDYVVSITSSEVLAEQLKHCVLRLGLDIPREPRFDRRREMELQVAVMRSAELLVCVVSDDAKVMDLEALRVLTTLESKTLDGADNVFDHMSYHSEAGDNNFCLWKVMEPKT